jgi:hypothetical protein
MPNETRLTDERKAFEEWFRKEHGWYEESLALNTGEWNAYRAATRAALEQNAEAHQAAVETLLQLHEHTARLEAELAAARADAERLDFLDSKNLPLKMGWCIGVAPAGNLSVRSVIQLWDEPKPIREAIDAARQAEAQGEKK